MKGSACALTAALTATLSIFCGFAPIADGFHKFDNLPYEHTVQALWLQDVSYGFNDVKENLVRAVSDVGITLKTEFLHGRLGLATFSDIPVGKFGYRESEDYCYKSEYGLTTYTERLALALSNTQMHSGRDWREAQLSAMVGALTDPASRWSSHTHTPNGLVINKYLVLATNSGYHVAGDRNVINSESDSYSESDADLDTPSPVPAFDVNDAAAAHTHENDNSAEANADEPSESESESEIGTGSGFAGYCLKADYPSTEQVRDLLKEKAVIPVFLVPSEISPIYRNLVRLLGGSGAVGVVQPDFSNVAAVFEAILKHLLDLADGNLPVCVGADCPCAGDDCCKGRDCARDAAALIVHFEAGLPNSLKIGIKQ